jgi:hypothetical protein
MTRPRPGLATAGRGRSEHDSVRLSVSPLPRNGVTDGRAVPVSPALPPVPSGSKHSRTEDEAAQIRLSRVTQNTGKGSPA